jgi:hypothetical protein
MLRMMRKLGLKKLWIIVFWGMAIWGGPVQAEANYVPLGRDSVTALFAKAVAVRLIPYTMHGDGLDVTITQLHHLEVDWNNNTIGIEFSFTVLYHKVVNLSASGRATVTGSGLLAPEEQELGFRLLAVNELDIQHVNSMVTAAVRLVLDKSLAGREFWVGRTPEQSAVLSKENWVAFLRIAIGRKLPWSIAGDGGECTVTGLTGLAAAGEPGQLAASFVIRGEFRKLLRVHFAGEAGLDLYVGLDAEHLAGMIRIIAVRDLDLKNTPGFVNDWARSQMNKKLAGQEYYFSWQ